MDTRKIQPEGTDALFIRNIFVFEQAQAEEIVLPFYADGYPGLVVYAGAGSHAVQPQDKVMPAAYLYGQTLHPITLHVSGPFTMLAFQLYPFVLKGFFGVDPVGLNNACFNMQELYTWPAVEQKLSQTNDTAKRISVVTAFLQACFALRKHQLDQAVAQALQLILRQPGEVTVAGLSKQLHLTTRTFERRFLKATGITAKDFIQITRFANSYGQLTDGNYENMAALVYANGYADQSHFIRVFKSFTGQTPGTFLRSLSVV